MKPLEEILKPAPIQEMEIFKFTGCLLGTAIGDSLGAVREGSSDILETREIGSRYTDDTAMMIGVAESLIYAVSLGGDADTIGAMTGAIAGAYYGAGDIPLRWKEKLENRGYIEELAEMLWER
ncbi:MAG: ADP-ribosylglycohydrolase family protein [Thermodesulfovibrionales bacterium]